MYFKQQRLEKNLTKITAVFDDSILLAFTLPFLPVFPFPFQFSTILLTFPSLSLFKNFPHLSFTQLDFIGFSAATPSTDSRSFKKLDFIGFTSPSLFLFKNFPHFAGFFYAAFPCTESCTISNTTIIKKNG